jgi:adenylate kinase
VGYAYRMVAAPVIEISGRAPEVVVLLLGLPGSGKGTQAQLLAKMGWSHVSAGGLVRSEVAMGTAWGRRAERMMQRGDLVPSSEIQGLLAPVLRDAQSPLVLEGYPKRLSEAISLSVLCQRAGPIIPFLLNVPQPVARHRLQGRRLCVECSWVTRAAQHTRCPRCGASLEMRRDDALDEAVLRRLQLFKTETLPLIAYYEGRGELESLDACATEMRIHKEIVSRIFRRL